MDSYVKKAIRKASWVYEKLLLQIIFFSGKGKLLTMTKILALNFLLHKRLARAKTLGALWTKPSFLSSLASFVGITHNINHLGNVYAIAAKNRNISQEIECQVIEWNKKLFNCRKPGFEGHVTSGGTESNLFLTWSGREWIKKFTRGKLKLVVSDFTHYSVKKSGRIAGLKEVRVPISEKTWGIDPGSLRELLDKLYKKNVKGVLLPITLGYSSTGAYDSLNEIINVVKEIKSLHKDFHIFIWIDAATQGLPLAFLEKDFRPFSSDLVKGLVVDFHKLGGSPIPAGIVLYRRQLRKIIQRPIDYLLEDDNSVLGSRPGFSALAIWANINSKDKEGWQTEFAKLNLQKASFIESLLELFPKAKLISGKSSLTCAIVIDKYFRRLPKKFEDEFSLNPADVGYRSVGMREEKHLLHYKINFLPGFNQNLFFRKLNKMRF